MDPEQRRPSRCASERHRSTLKRIVRFLAFDREPAQGREGVQAVDAAEFAVAARLDAAERHRRFVLNRGAVDMANTAFDASRDAESAGYVAAIDRRGKAVFGVVGNADR